MGRQANIELLRVVCMILIILHHINPFLQGNDIVVPSIQETLFDIINRLGNFHVDVFILITGYFGINNRKKSLVKILKIIVFYLLVTNVTGMLLGEKFNWYQILNPIQEEPWWFMCNYIYLILLAPYINKVLNQCDTQKKWNDLLGIALLFNCYFCWFLFDPKLNFYGHNLTTFVVMYVIGRYIQSDYSKNIISMIRRVGGGNFIGSFLVSLLFVIIASVINHVFSLELRIPDYNSPFIMILGVTFFLIFKEWHIKSSNIILLLSESAIGVYLVHSNPVFGKYIEQIFIYGYNHISDMSAIQMIYPFCFAVVLYIAITVIDKIRILLFRII